MGIYKELLQKKKILSVTGLGYVGLPLALEFAKYFKVIGLDINADRVELMKKNIDPSSELDSNAFEGCDIEFTSDPMDLSKAHFHIIGVPTDISENYMPNLKPLLGASRNIGKIIKKGDYAVFESTVYPGCTEEDCVPLIEAEANLKMGEDFKVGYSPERIVPGDKVRTFTKILKIVSGCDDEALEEIDKVYNHVLENGTYRASSIKVAEAAKVIENTQRDINISLMNELAIIFDKIGIDTTEVINAAGSKWNFHKYTPGLVGGHCIGVDPYYLMHKSKQLGYDPQVIAAGRRVNNYIPSFIAKRLVTTLIDSGKSPIECKVLVMGITFKEDVSDIRNSKVADLIGEIIDFSVEVDVIDVHASKEEVFHQYKIDLKEGVDDDYDAIVLAVGHKEYKEMTTSDFEKLSKSNIILFDIKGVVKHLGIQNYWKL